MAKFRKKPVVIEAEQFDGTRESANAIIGWAGAEPVENLSSNIVYGDVAHVLLIPTLEGQMTADAGDWIIRGVKGEFYPCKPDIFDATYDPVV